MILTRAPSRKGTLSGSPAAAGSASAPGPFRQPRSARPLAFHSADIPECAAGNVLKPLGDAHSPESRAGSLRPSGGRASWSWSRRTALCVIGLSVCRA